MKIAVFGKRRQSADDIPRIVALIKDLSDRGVFIAIQRHFYEAMVREFGTQLDADDVFDDSDFTADAAISIGGDGTFLRTARWVGPKETPIVGFNTGHLGFLAEESLDNAPEIVDNLISGNYNTESRSLLEICATVDGDKPYPINGWQFALNEVAILRNDSASMVTVHTYLDDIEVASYQGDGLIISTPTGSTAYNLSVGGPIIQPTAPCWALSPVAPHALTMRPLVVSDNHLISARVESRSESYRVSLDGRTFVLPINVDLHIRRAPFVVKVIHRTHHTFVDTLSSKLLWGISRR